MKMIRCSECGKRLFFPAPLECVVLGKEEQLVEVVDFGDCICPSCARCRRELIAKIYDKKTELLELLRKNCGGVL